MEQATFSELEHDMKKRRTRRELFLEEMDGPIPWAGLEARVEPFYPKAMPGSAGVSAGDDAATPAGRPRAATLPEIAPT